MKWNEKKRKEKNKKKKKEKKRKLKIKKKDRSEKGRIFLSPISLKIGSVVVQDK